MAEDLKQAAREMEAPLRHCEKEIGRDALPPEQRALQKLSRPTPSFGKVQVAFW